MAEKEIFSNTEKKYIDSDYSNYSYLHIKYMNWISVSKIYLKN